MSILTCDERIPRMAATWGRRPRFRDRQHTGLNKRRDGGGIRLSAGSPSVIYKLTHRIWG
ncbi:MAG: hypothetical protein ACRCXB_06605 [Aeromonadaceae bacterium]